MSELDVQVRCDSHVIAVLVSVSIRGQVRSLYFGLWSKHPTISSWSPSYSQLHNLSLNSTILGSYAHSGCANALSNKMLHAQPDGGERTRLKGYLRI
jgi:hypothetical protein